MLHLLLCAYNKMITLRHYDRYIIKLSSRPICKEDGKVYIQVDETIRQRLQAKLVEAVLKFKVM